MVAKFIKIQFVKQECGPTDSWTYINTDQIRRFYWSDEEFDNTWCNKLVIEYAGDAESDIFWLRLREFDAFLKEITGKWEHKAFTARSVLCVPTLEEAGRLYGGVVPIDLADMNADMEEGAFENIDDKISKATFRLSDGKIISGYLSKADANKLYDKL